MRKKTAILCCFAALAILAMGAGVAYAVQVVAQAGVSAQATRAFTPGALLDDFSQGTSSNLWGGVTATYMNSGATINASYVSDTAVVFGSSGKSLQLTYDVTPSTSWASYNTSLGNTNFSAGSGYGFKYLSFWVKGSANNILFKIQITNNDSSANTNSASVYVTDYLTGGVTTSWQKVVIPLDAFMNITNWTSIKDMSIVFENSQSGWNGTPLSGTVYIDNISFGKQFLGYLRLNNFNKKGPDINLVHNTACITNATGGQSNITAYGATGDAIAASAQYVSSPYSLQLDFSGVSVSTANYVAYYMILGGGSDGWTTAPHDLSAYGQLSFYIKGATGKEYGIKAELQTTNMSTYNYQKNIISSSWSKQVIPFSNFKDGDSNGVPTGNTLAPNMLIKCTLTYGYWIYYWNLNKIDAGTVYLDDVQFEVLNYAPDTTPPAAPSTPTASGSGLVILSTTASSAATDPTMEFVRFDYSLDQANWKAACYNYDTSSSTYSATWNTSGLSAGAYYLRAVAMDAAGNQAVSSIKTYTK